MKKPIAAPKNLREYDIQGKRIKYRNSEYMVLSARHGTKWYTIQMAADDGKVYTLRVRHLDAVTLVKDKLSKKEEKVREEARQKVSDWNNKKYEKRSTWLDQVYAQKIEPGDSVFIRVRGYSTPQKYPIDKITNNGVVSHNMYDRSIIINSRHIVSLQKEKTKNSVVKRKPRKSRSSMLDLYGL